MMSKAFSNDPKNVMSISKSTVRRLAETIKLVCRIGDGGELVCLLGSGTERNNQEALETWISNQMQGLDGYTERNLIKYFQLELEKAMNTEFNNYGH